MSKEYNKALIPERRFPDFMTDESWKIMSFGKAFSRITTKNAENNTNVLTISAQHGLVSQTEYFKRSVAAKDLTGYYLLQKGDFAYNKSYSKGYPMGAIKPLKLYEQGVVSTLYICFKTKNGFSSDYFEHYFESGSLNSEVSKIAQEGGRAHGLLNVSVKEFFRDVRLMVPTLPEQQKIADCLSSFDERIALEEKKLDVLKAYKKGLMQQLFPAASEELPKVRFPEFLNQNGWEPKTLGEVCHMQAGKFVRASEITHESDDGLHPCFGGNGLRGYTRTFTHVGKYSLIGRQGALCGNVNLVSGSFHATEHAVVVTPTKSVDTDWLFYMLMNLNLNQYATGQAQPGLSVDNLEKVALCVPCNIKEQQKIAEFLDSIKKLIDDQTEKLSFLKLYKKGLMQQLFPLMEKMGI
ncbi:MULTISPECIES: restriction endonuclease subunit S [Vibrio]|uniref:restriction endonuclease subunit S n=1 Tax=Vibrio TaxID=662 RepID=UPI000BA9AC34|nr:restriction endonuclease subunit S [Vibrio cholerae]PAS05135.1 hypothetical protein CGT80_09135 [Vibrio cholerae]